MEEDVIIFEWGCQDHDYTDFDRDEYDDDLLVEKIPELCLPNTVLKTTPQRLSDTDKNQALANLGIQEKIEKLVNITYLGLKALKDNSKLIPGQQYRITDYVTTTVQANTRSAGHQFDIIVTADNDNTLNEVARACRSKFDIEKYKDAYSSTLGENVSYIGLYQYEGKEYHLYESINASHKVQMLVDFYRVDKLYEEGTIEYPYCIGK